LAGILPGEEGEAMNREEVSEKIVELAREELRAVGGPSEEKSPAGDHGSPSIQATGPGELHQDR
jgi:hypothetical protein